MATATETAAAAAAVRPGGRLVLHFDVNQTIMVGDPAGSVSMHEGINKAIAHACVVRRRERTADAEEEWEWLDGSRVEVDSAKDFGVEPPEEEESAEEAAQHAALQERTMVFDSVLPQGQDHFTEVFHGLPCRQFTAAPHGRPFRSLYRRVRQRLMWPEDVPAHPHLTTSDSAHFIVPAFFHTLCALREAGRDFVCVFRTFGTDLPEVQAAMNAFSRGEHYLFPHVGTKHEPAAWARLYPHWVLRRGDGSPAALTVVRATEAEGAEGDAAAAGHEESFPNEEALEQFLNKELEARNPGSCCVAIQDDYYHWRDNKYLPSAGKTLWFTKQHGTDGGGGTEGPDSANADAHHIFFDDNIHHKEHDSIVCIRGRASPSERFHSVSGGNLLHYHNSMLVKAFVVKAVLDRDYFLTAIARCEEKFGASRGELPL